MIYFKDPTKFTPYYFAAGPYIFTACENVGAGSEIVGDRPRNSRGRQRNSMGYILWGHYILYNFFAFLRGICRGNKPKAENRDDTGDEPSANYGFDHV